jgi:hypothetical protein
VVHGSMIPGSITGIHPDDGCKFGDFKIMTTDSSHKLENLKMKNLFYQFKIRVTGNST